MRGRELQQQTFREVKRQLTRLVETETKKRIAKNLFEATNLSLEQISELTEISPEILRKELQYLKRPSENIIYEFHPKKSKISSLIEEIENKLGSLNEHKEKK